MGLRASGEGMVTRPQPRRTNAAITSKRRMARPRRKLPWRLAHNANRTGTANNHARRRRARLSSSRSRARKK